MKKLQNLNALLYTMQKMSERGVMEEYMYASTIAFYLGKKKSTTYHHLMMAEKFGLVEHLSRPYKNRSIYSFYMTRQGMNFLDNQKGMQL